MRRRCVTFDMWDFTGDPRYRSIYPCFSCQTSVHLAVFSIEEGTSEIIRWLSDIQSLSMERVPVIVVFTHMDKVRETCHPPAVLLYQFFLFWTETWTKRRQRMWWCPPLHVRDPSKEYKYNIRYQGTSCGHWSGPVWKNKVVDNSFRGEWPWLQCAHVRFVIRVPQINI